MFRPVCVLFSCLLTIALASAGYSQSLADLAKKEKERRQAIKGETKLITNVQVAKNQEPTDPSATQAAPADKSAADKTTADGVSKPESEAAAAKPASDESVDLKGRTESYWKQTMADARKRVQDLENEANVLVLKFTDLQNRFYRESDGFKQQDIQREMQKTIYEQDKNKETLARAKADLADLEQEARKSGALPGWIK